MHKMSEMINKSVDVSSSKDHHVTTSFVDDGVSVEVPFTAGEEADITVRATSIPEFLEKPQLLRTGVWTSASAQSVQLTSISVADALLNTGIWSKKLETFNLFRGTACLRVQINANPFQQGRLLLHFIPCYEQIDDSGSSPDTTYNANITTKSTQANVELDCRDTSVVMKVPYVTPAHFYDKANIGYDWGTFFLSVMSPMKTGSAGDTGVDYSIFMWFEDFELAAPCFTQASKMKTGSKRSKRVLNKFTTSLESEKKVGTGAPISDVLSAVSTASGSLSDIPVLGAFMGPLSWATNLASGVASAFGWAKPMTNVVPGIMAAQQQRYSANSDGSDPAYPLGLTSQNALGVNDCCSIRGEDEMSFNFLKKIPALTRSFEWTTDNASGTQLMQHLIAPSSLYAPGSKTVGSVITTYGSGSPVWYLSDQFQLWRGTIKVRISFAKTIFHSGRLLVTFDPVVGMGHTYPAVSNTGSTPMLREIIDIREAKEVEFIVPFYSPTNYLNWDEFSGSLLITVLSELRVPESASPSVQVLVFYSGGDDLELQGPRSTSNLGPYTTQAHSLPSDMVIGGDPVKPYSVMHCEQSIGESFTSIKQVLSRYSQVKYGGAALAVLTSGNGWCVWPYWTNLTYTNASTGAQVNNAIGGDFYCLVAPLYAFYRGSMKIRFGHSSSLNDVYTDPRPIADETATVAFGSVPVVNGVWGTGNNWSVSGAYRNLSLGFVSSLDSIDYPSVSVPYMSRYHCSLVSPQVATSNNSVNPVPRSSSKSAVEPSQSLNSMIVPQITVPTRMHRAAGDDFQFSYFIGTVPKIFTVA